MGHLRLLCLQTNSRYNFMQKINFKNIHLVLSAGYHQTSCQFYKPVIVVKIGRQFSALYDSRSVASFIRFDSRFTPDRSNIVQTNFKFHCGHVRGTGQVVLKYIFLIVQQIYFGETNSSVVNLKKHFTIVIYDSRVVLTRKLPILQPQSRIYARKMFIRLATY